MKDYIAHSPFIAMVAWYIVNVQWSWENQDHYSFKSHIKMHFEKKISYSHMCVRIFNNGWTVYETQLNVYDWNFMITSSLQN
jgi:hypothetical protein